MSTLRFCCTTLLLLVIAGFSLGCGQGLSGSSACPVNGAPGTSTRAGPYATNDTALQRWREAQDAGCEVSNGVFPCYDGTATRGYCFNVFF